MHRWQAVLGVVFSVGLLAIPAIPASGQDDACGGLLLLALRDRALQVGDADRSFLNLYSFCSAPPRSEAEAREDGLDVGLLYKAAAIPAAGADRFERLKAWAGESCGAVAAQRANLPRALAAAAARVDAATARAYQQCVASRGLACYAVPAGSNVVGLFLKWSPDDRQPREPEIVAARASGAALASDLMDPARSEGATPNPVSSLAHARVPRSGLLKLFLRTGVDADVLFDVETDEGRCVPDKVAPAARPAGVYSVRQEGTSWASFAEHGGRTTLAREGLLWVDAPGLQQAVDDLALQKKLPRPDAGIADLVPVIDGVPLPGVHPLNPADRPDDQVPIEGQAVTHLHFHLTRSDDNKAAWDRLLYLDALSFSRRVDFTLGFENGAVLTTWVTKESHEPTGEAYLSVVPRPQAAAGGLLVGGALVLFLLLAGKTDVIRDSTASVRPDGRRPYSLARAQMAFWFFLVIAAYFGLWMVTGDKDTITTSTVALIGISAGTALGAAIVDSGRSGRDLRERSLEPDELDRPAEAIVRLLEERRQAAEGERRTLLAARSRIAEGDEAALEANRRAVEQAEDRLDRLRRQIEFFRLPAWKRVLYDLLGEGNVISFHKFQIFVWTLVLGTIFVAEVIRRLEMPEFSATLLAIMGISGGTYIGFKLPEPRGGGS
jgi:hypothetical protein